MDERTEPMPELPDWEAPTYEPISLPDGVAPDAGAGTQNLIPISLPL